jgi:pilus assembly protein CpaB
MAEPLLSRIVVGLGIGGAVAAIAYGSYMAILSPPQEKTIVSPPPSSQTSVVVAATPISRGEVIAAEKLSSLPIAGPAPADTLTRFDAAVGRVAIADISTGQLVLASLISSDPGRAGLGYIVPDGMRAVALRISDEIAVSNLVRPGDLVDVEIVLRESKDRPNEARTLLQKVKVLTIGETLDSGASAAGGGRSKAEAARTLTLALSPEQATLLTLARNLGQYAIALRNPKDEGANESRLFTRDDLLGRSGEPSAGAAWRPIELISGADRRLIHPSLIR